MWRGPVRDFDAARRKFGELCELGNPLGDHSESRFSLMIADESIARRNDDLRDGLVNHDADTAERIDRIEQAEMQSRAGFDAH